MSFEQLASEAGSLSGVIDLLDAVDILTPLVLDSPHSGEIAPADFCPAVSRTAWLHAVDRYVDQLFAAAPALGVPLIRAVFPRIYLDVNRALDDLDPACLADGWDQPFAPSAKARLGKGLVWMNTPPNAAPLYATRLKRQEVKFRIERYYHPYHDRLAALINRSHGRHGFSLHLNCHSMQSVSHQMHEEGAGVSRPDFILSDRESTTCGSKMVGAVEEYLVNLGYSVEVNTLFKGAEIVRRHGCPDNGRHSLQIEINRALYMDETTLSKTAGFDKLKHEMTGLIGHLGRLRLP